MTLLVLRWGWCGEPHSSEVQTNWWPRRRARGAETWLPAAWPRMQRSRGNKAAIVKTNDTQQHQVGHSKGGTVTSSDWTEGVCRADELQWDPCPVDKPDGLRWTRATTLWLPLSGDLGLLPSV